MDYGDVRKALNDLALEIPLTERMDSSGEIPWPRDLYRFKREAGRFLFIVEGEGQLSGQFRDLTLDYYEGQDAQTIRTVWRALKTPTSGVVVWVMDFPHSHHREVMGGMMEALKLSTKMLVVIMPLNFEKDYCRQLAHSALRYQGGLCQKLK